MPCEAVSHSNDFFCAVGRADGGEIIVNIIGFGFDGGVKLVRGGGVKLGVKHTQIDFIIGVLAVGFEAEGVIIVISAHVVKAYLLGRGEVARRFAYLIKLLLRNGKGLRFNIAYFSAAAYDAVCVGIGLFKRPVARQIEGYCSPRNRIAKVCGFPADFA